MSDIVLRSSGGTASVTLEGFTRDRSGGAKFTFVISSRGFTARSSYALEPEELRSLIGDLERMHESLTGSAEIRLHIEEEHVSLSMGPAGRILVRGVIVHYQDPVHRLEFGFYSDQSCIPEFLRGLTARDSE